MTFEQKLKELLKTDFNNLFGPDTEHNRLVRVANDISSKSLEKENSFLAVIKTGQGLRTAIPGYDVVNLSLYIEFYFDRNWLQTFLSEMKDYIKGTNAIAKVEIIDDAVINYRINFNNPTPSATALDQQVEGRTMQFSQVVLMGEVVYSEYVSFNVPTIYFDYNDGVDVISYQIKNLLSYDYLSQPSFESTQALGETTTKKEIISYEASHTLSILVTDTDTFAQFIKSKFDQTKEMYLIVDGESYTIQNVIVNYKWLNGTRSLNLTFTE